MNKIDLSGRRAVVTGAAAGIGYGIAERFRAEGAAVALWDIDPEKLAEARSTSGTLTDSPIFTIDVTKPEAVERVTQETDRALGGIDILVNCAGIVGPTLPLDAYPAEDFDKVVKISLYGTFNCCKAVVPIMRRNDYGRIVNFASMAGKDGNPNACAYSAAKAGIIALTKSLGKELAKTGIRANVVAPAVIRTAMNDAVTPQQLSYMLEKIPMGRIGTVAEVAALVAWLASAECSFSTGAVFDISGGRATY